MVLTFTSFGFFKGSCRVIFCGCSLRLVISIVFLDLKVVLFCRFALFAITCYLTLLAFTVLLRFFIFNFFIGSG